MKKLLQLFFNYQSMIYKAFLFVFTCLFIVYFFPTKGQFKYEFSKGQAWEYENLYAPFDFAILKSEKELLLERVQLKKEIPTYFNQNTAVEEQAKVQYAQKFSSHFTYPVNSTRYKRYFEFGLNIIQEIYSTGVLPLNYNHEGGDLVGLIQNHAETELNFDQLLKPSELSRFLDQKLSSTTYERFKNEYYKLLFEAIEPNLVYDERFNEQLLESAYSKLAISRDLIVMGSIMISKGELVDETNFQELESLKLQYDTRLYSDANIYWILLGYIILVGLTLLMLFLFIYKYRPIIFNNNTKLTFIFFNVMLVVVSTITVLNFDSSFLYIVPICILPLILKAFFDARVGLFVHVLTVLLLGFIVPNSFEYIFLQIMAGIVTVLSVSELYKRANLFISVGQIICIYLIGYFAFFVIHEGEIDGISFPIIGLFVLNGVFTLFVQPLIYLFEKLFNLVSDVSLLELSDTNSDFFKEFSNKAPGTFHHSLQVSNLAESAASAIGANALLTRVGALYHDIGKISNPVFFSENQRGSISPHNDISPKESAQIIIDHVIKGVEAAKKIKLPDRVVDFIRTHHGTSRVYFFYKKQEELFGVANSEDFSYLGPRPFSKETAILMMADSIEAASKSLKEPTIELLKNFVNKIVNQQLEEKQFMNSNITLAEIETVKKVFIDKLINIYHLRIEYPE
ncbi:HDIG domain-containing protein [Flavobacteriaceae bacterium]|nr:HDIG domain-containing protein [Flavobacteriaceae bacterium]